MTAPQVEVQLIAVVTAAACALPGVFLVLRRMAMMSDAISHSILPGIVVAFLLTGSLSSPWLILAAAATGVLTVVLVELLFGTGLVREDAAIGLVFPALFSFGVLLVSRHAGNVHLDVDVVLLGELAFAPFHRFTLAGRDLGPQGLWVMGTILLLNLSFIVAFFKELKLSTFDRALAASLGLSPALFHYALMSLVSVTAVGAFDAVGSILVVALMVAPPATAYLLTERLGAMVVASAGIGTAAALSGYWLAFALDASIAGAMATMAGALFALAYLFAPERGLVAAAGRRTRQRREFAATTLAIHLLQHEGTAEEASESAVDHLHEELRWSREHAASVVRDALRGKVVTREDGRLRLTDEGRRRARETLAM